MVKASGSVWNKERHGRDFICHRQAFDPTYTRHDAMGNSETTARFESPKMIPSVTKNIPNLVEERRAFDGTGVSAPNGGNAFAKSTYTRPAYLTDPSSPAENHAIRPQGPAGGMILTSLARDDPLEYVNNVEDPGATTRTLHAYQPTTRELEAADRIAARRPPAAKTASGALHNTRQTTLYDPEPVAQEWLKSTYSNTISARSNFDTVKSSSVANVLPVKSNGFVRSTFVAPFGAVYEQQDLDVQKPEVAQRAMMQDPFVVDTKHAHKKH